MTLPTPETLRDRVAAAINDVLSCSFNEDEALDMADAALAAIPKLSPEAMETIRRALEHYESCDVVPETVWGENIAKARAELQALP